MNLDPRTEELLARARQLTKAGVRGEMPGGSADGRNCSFRRLAPSGNAKVSPANDTVAAWYCAQELAMMLGFKSRGAGGRHGGRCIYPTIVPTAVTRLVRLENVRSTPIRDQDVLDGRCPVTWMSATRHISLSAPWIAGLIELQRCALEALSGPDATVRPELERVPSTADELRFAVDMLLAASEGGLTVLGRGQVTAPVVSPGVRLARTEVGWLTVSVGWTEALSATRRHLPSPRGTVVLQALASQALTGLVRECATGAARYAASRALRDRRHGHLQLEGNPK